LGAVFTHLMAVDGNDHTVILFPMQNEAGILGTERCYCANCTRLFEGGEWRKRYAERANEAFSANCIARYMDCLTESVKKVYPLPVYINCWLSFKNSNHVPGKNYPSGGPVERVLDVYRDAIQHIDFIAPDIYSHELGSFRYICGIHS